MLSRSFQTRIKYMLDRFAAVIAFLLALPFFLILAAAIKLDSRGPILFGQERLGLDRKTFVACKFRTMIHHADRLLNQDGSVPVGVERITRVGRFLRLFSLDELPQLINIVRGEMSFVGPRPTMVGHLARYTERQKQRFTMRPGITGLAQVRGRNTLKWSQRIEHDLWYIENYSLCLDLKILTKTIKVVVLREGIVLDRNPEEVDDLGQPRTMS